MGISLSKGGREGGKGAEKGTDMIRKLERLIYEERLKAKYASCAKGRAASLLAHRECERHQTGRQAIGPRWNLARSGAV